MFVCLLSLNIYDTVLDVIIFLSIPYGELLCLAKQIRGLRNIEPYVRGFPIT